MKNETTEKPSVVEDKRETTGSATHDWDDSVMCRCFRCDSCFAENRVDKTTYPKFCNQCGIGFDELNF